MESTVEQSAPAAELETQVATEPADTSAEAEAQTDEQSTEGEPPALELVEIERNGKRFAIPKELEPELLMQSDYTKKATEVAETRKALEAREAQFQQATAIHGELVQGLAHVTAIERELQQLRQVDLNALSQTDPGQAQQVFLRMGQLKDARDQAANAIAQRHQALSHMQTERIVKAVEDSRTKAAKEIPGWSAKTDQELLEYVNKQGFTEQQARAIAADFGSVKTVWKAMQYDKLMSKQQAKPAAAAPAPVAHVVRSTTATKTPESMATEEWMKWRTKQVRR